MRAVAAPPPLPAVITTVQPRDLSEVVAVIPSATISTNSRGETLVSIRGRNEREAVVRIDGVPVSDPWDDRLNLAILPASVVGGVSAEALGASSAGSGAVLDIESVRAPAANATVEVGDFGYARIGGAASLGGGRGRGATLAVEGLTRDAMAVPGDADLPFSQGPGRSRTNTSRRQGALFASARDETAFGHISGFALLADADYGVAPESHLDPNEARVRFWRVPRERRLISAAKLTPDEGGAGLSAQLWYHGARRTIRSYTDATYRQVETAERFADDAVGGAIGWSANGLAVGASADHARHRESAVGAPDDRFGRQTYAVWADAERAVDGLGAVSAGLRHEGFRTGDTGGRPRGEDLSVTTGRLGWSRQVAPDLTLAARGARLGRLPSQRELYGAALGRFVINPALGPETAWTGEAELRFERPAVQLRVTPFVEDRDSIIEQRVIEAAGGNRRQRFNAPGFTSLGAELAASVAITRDVSASALVTVIDFDRKDNAGPLLERPDTIANAALRYAPPFGLGAAVALRHRGAAFSLEDDGSVRRLDPAAAVDLELSYRWESAEAFVRVDNATDAEVLPQLGLPAPGRMLRLGVRLIPGRQPASHVTR